MVTTAAAATTIPILFGVATAAAAATTTILYPVATAAATATIAVAHHTTAYAVARAASCAASRPAVSRVHVGTNRRADVARLLIRAVAIEIWRIRHTSPPHDAEGSVYTVPGGQCQVSGVPVPGSTRRTECDGKEQPLWGTTRGSHKGHSQGAFTRGSHKGQSQGEITRGNECVGARMRKVTSRSLPRHRRLPASHQGPVHLIGGQSACQRARCRASLPQSLRREGSNPTWSAPPVRVMVRVRMRVRVRSRLCSCVCTGRLAQLRRYELVSSFSLDHGRVHLGER